MNRKRIIFLMIIVIILGVGGWLATGARLFAGSEKDNASTPKAAPRRVRVMHPKPIGDVTDVAFPGRAQASREATLFFRVSGPLVAVDVKPGDSVLKGQVLMRIDPRDYERRVSGIEAGIKATEAQFICPSLIRS